MTNTEIFEVISIIGKILPIATTTIIIFALPQKWFVIYRMLIAILMAWLISIIFKIYIYNPSGIAMGTEQGLNSPQMKFDNNTTSITILVGWISPALTAAIVYAVILLRVAIRQKAH
jgi:hypothetical protein